MIKVLVVFGTRPEAIKMAPVVKELGKHHAYVKPTVCVTGQHREMLDQVLSLFEITPDYDLDLMKEDQSPSLVAAGVLRSVGNVLAHERPDVVLVQGDTTSAMAAALAAFHEKIPVGHVEAGLRTYERYSPHPEEINRHLISVLATWHFAPTQRAVDCLLREGIPAASIFLTGNTVVDALLTTVEQEPDVPLGVEIQDNHRMILVTAHRRENFGQPLKNICWALRELVQRNRDIEIVYPVHLNPNVQRPAHDILAGQPRVHLTAPLDYKRFVHVMARSYLVLTDSGGIQEEAPALGKPVLVMRQETERPEAVEAGTVKIIGAETDAIIRHTEWLLNDPAEYEKMSRAISPYGDGKAARRIVRVLLEVIGDHDSTGIFDRRQGGGHQT